MSKDDLGADKLSEKERNDLILSAEEEANSQILNDPIENTDEFLLIRFDIEAKVDKALAMSTPSDEPYCARYWNEKQRILKEEFHIEWNTPAQMNPNIRFY